MEDNKENKNNKGVMEASERVDADSPWFSGHFPNDPVLPGIAQLNLVMESIEAALGRSLVLQSLVRIKFKRLVRPGDVLDIRIEPGTKEDHYAFKIHTNNREVCSGRLVLIPRKEQ